MRSVIDAGYLIVIVAAFSSRSPRYTRQLREKRQFIAALVISKARGGLPAPGFFDCARPLGARAIRTVRTHDGFMLPS
jgi:hypothetical protein